MLNPIPNQDQLLQRALHHHQSGRLQQAEALYREILRQNPRQADALHFLGRIADHVGRHEVAIELIRQAISSRPNYPEAYNHLGNALRRMGRIDEAIAVIRQAIALNPNYLEALNNLGNVLFDRRQLDEAIAAYRQAIALNPNIPELHNNLGIALKEKGRLDEAIGACREAIRRRPNYPEAYYNLGDAFWTKGHQQEAIDAYRQATELKPDYFEAHLNLGNVLHDEGRISEAIVVFRTAIALRPNSPQALGNLGNALRSMGQLHAAIAACRRSIALKPDFPQVHLNLGNALQGQGQLEEAITAFRQSIALKPDYVEAHNNLGSALFANGQLDEAMAAYRQALALEGDHPQTHYHIGIVLYEQCRLDEAMAEYRQAIALKPDFTDAHSNLVYGIHFDPGCDARRIAEELRNWNRQHAQPLAKFIKPLSTGSTSSPQASSGQGHSNDDDPQRRLRIGYVSPDFRQHPVGRFLLPLFAHHDKTQIEIFAYDQHVASDVITAQLRSFTDGWRSIAELSDIEAADLIRQDRIDILVDLTMHMAHNRLLVFAHKPAPVQVTYLAYCSSTGMEAIDYRLSDPYLDPPGMDESIYSERTIRLPESYWCYQPSAGIPEVGPLPSLSERSESNRPALSDGFITFGCLNNFCKVSEPALGVWAAILCAVPNSTLLLHAHEGSQRQRVRERLEKEGINPDRVRFVGKQSLSDYFRSYNQIDIGLDTFPYGGGTTTCDAPWMGVPVVSLLGEMAVGRGGLSILSNIGLPELVARSHEQYVRLASELANDLPRLANLRSTLRQRMQQSPLMDAPRFARNIESAFRQMWKPSGLKPETSNPKSE